MADKKNTDDDDFALFRAEVSDAKPLNHQPTPIKTVKPQPKVTKRISESSESVKESFSDMYAPETIGNEEYLEYRGPGIQHKLFSKMRQGKIHLDAELDLHGMTIAKAEPSLADFLDICQQQQIRYVRIIHGKGWGSRDNKPVLKSKINHWLRQSSIVLAFCSATIEDGGTGAVYVLLKRLTDN